MANLKVNIAGVELQEPHYHCFRLFRIRSGI